MSDLSGGLERRYGTSEEHDWHALVRVWMTNLAPVRLAYRLYVMLGNIEAAPKDISLTQFRKFVEDCHVLKPVPSSKVDVDLIFTRANRVNVHHGAGEYETETEVVNGRKDPNRMGQDEFVHALVRLGLLRAEQRAASSTAAASAARSMASSFELLMEECVKPHASFDLEDDLRDEIRGRQVRAALAKHREPLHHQFTRWAAADKVHGCADDGMSLEELLLALKEARVLDERCTAREVTRLFVMINAEDEIYMAKPGGHGKGNGKGRSKSKGAAELDFDEYCEIVCRICDQKCPRELRDGPFGNTLDTWLRLFFLPALRSARHRG